MSYIPETKINAIANDAIASAESTGAFGFNNSLIEISPAEDTVITFTEISGSGLASSTFTAATSGAYLISYTLTGYSQSGSAQGLIRLKKNESDIDGTGVSGLIFGDNVKSTFSKTHRLVLAQDDQIQLAITETGNSNSIYIDIGEVSIAIVRLGAG